MTDIDIDAIRQREQAATPGPWRADDTEVYTDDLKSIADEQAWVAETLKDDPETTRADSEFIAHARQDVPALLAKVDELTAELAKVRDQLTAANRRADGLANDLRSAVNGNTAFANENARLRSQLDSFEALLNQTQDRLLEAREQVFAQKPVIEAAEAWAEMRETDDVTPTEARKLAGALHDAIEQHRLMVMALTSARAENAEATR